MSNRGVHHFTVDDVEIWSEDLQNLSHQLNSLLPEPLRGDWTGERLLQLQGQMARKDYVTEITVAPKGFIRLRMYCASDPLALRLPSREVIIEKSQGPCVREGAMVISWAYGRIALEVLETLRDLNDSEDQA